MINQRFSFLSTPDQVKAFRAWLSKLLASEVLGRTEDELWRKYVEQGFAKGQARVWDDFKARSDPEYLGKPEDFYKGSREEFLRSAFRQPVAVEKVKLLASRVYTDLKGVTDGMAATMSRVLTDGLVQGRSPREVARTLADAVDISLARAERISRTETLRAHAEGQLQALEDMGVTEVGVMVEWTVTNDSKLCPVCRRLGGVVIKVADAHGLIPAHPHCRCAWIPAGVGEDGRGQKRGKAAQRALATLNLAWRGGSRWRPVTNDQMERLVAALSEQDRAFRQLLINVGRR